MAGNPRHATINFKAQDSFLDLRMYLGRFTTTVITGELVFQGGETVTIPSTYGHLGPHYSPLLNACEPGN